MFLSPDMASGRDWGKDGQKCGRTKAWSRQGTKSGQNHKVNRTTSEGHAIYTVVTRSVRLTSHSFVHGEPRRAQLVFLGPGGTSCRRVGSVQPAEMGQNHVLRDPTAGLHPMEGRTRHMPVTLIR